MTGHTAPPPSTHRRSTTALALALPLALLGATTAVAWSWKDVLPDPVASHWGTDGVDGFASLTGAVAVPLIVGTAFVVGLWAFAWYRGALASTRRLINGTNVWLAAFLSVVTLGMLHLQKGLADAADVGGIGGVIVLALGLATVAGVLVALLTPAGAPRPTTDPVPADASRVPLGDAERAMWFRRVRGGAGLAVGFLAAAATGTLAIATGDWWMLLVPVGTVALVASMFSWIVRVDDTGLSVRSSLGIPRSHIPLDEVVQARATTVRCFAEFGGWGWRTARDGRTGILLRSGDTLEVTRTGGGIFVVTVDDAATAAGLLNTLADRVRRTDAVE